MRQIKVSSGQLVTVDDEDYEQLAQYKWCLVSGYAMRKMSKADGQRKEYIHKRLMKVRKNEFVLHLNGNKLDCRKENMVIAPHSLRQQRMVPRGQSGHKGVIRAQDKWAVHIGVQGKTLHLGRFDDLNEAARAYNKAALDYYGPHALLNDVEPAVERQQPTAEPVEQAHE